MINIYDSLHLDKSLPAHLFVPCQGSQGSAGESDKGGQGRIPAVLYFPGCGGGLFFRRIALAAISLLLHSGVAVVLPGHHLCCGYPLLAAGESGLYDANLQRNRGHLAEAVLHADAQGLDVGMVVTACGTCRESLARHGIAGAGGVLLPQGDIVQLLSERMPHVPSLSEERLIFHASCHSAWAGVKATADSGKGARALERLTGASILLNKGCCGESGTGAYTSPEIYNVLRERKRNNLQAALAGYAAEAPILVSCPSCKIGIARTLMGMKSGHPARGKGRLFVEENAEPVIDAHRPVLHTAEWLAQTLFGEKWYSEWKEKLNADRNSSGMRKVSL